MVVAGHVSEQRALAIQVAPQTISAVKLRFNGY